MSEPTHKPPPTPVAFYAYMLPQLIMAARSVGYALAVHGSMRRDLDLVAVPWVEGAGTHEQLLDALCEVVGFEREPPARSGPTEKPLGRRAYVIHLSTGVYIDLSVTPRGA